MSLGRLRAEVTPDELALHVADAEVNGPWHEERADYAAAAVRHTLIAVHGGDPPDDLAELLPAWGDAQAVTLDPAAGLLMLKGLTS